MKAVVYGGGNIGRGFLGQLLYESGYETVFIDVNQELIDKLNTDRSYPIKIVCNQYQKEILIKNIRALHSNEAVPEIATADIINCPPCQDTNFRFIMTPRLMEFSKRNGA